MDNFIIVYLDDQSQKENDFISQLKEKFGSDFKIFNECDSCIDYITDLTDQVLFILSNIVSRILIPLIHDIHQIVSIYILYQSNNKDENWTNEWKKLRKIFNDTSLMYNQLHYDIRHFNEISVPTTLISSYSIDNFDELRPALMYSLLLKECILKTTYDENDIKEFANFCRKHCDILEVSLESIKKFENNYEISDFFGTNSPVRWYAKERFIYFTLNKALRTQNIEVILMMGFFIQDLHCQLAILEMNNEKLPEMIVYRGQGLSFDQLENIKNNKDGFLLFNSFLSTSTNRDVSYIYADSVLENKNLVGILFEMKIGQSETIRPCASVGNISSFKEEEEILFSMNTVFRIDEVKEIEDRLWQINLTLINDNDKILTPLTEYMQNMCASEPKGLHRIGKLILIMGEIKKAKEVFNILLNRTSDTQHEQLTSIHHNIGCAYYLEHNLSNALIHYQKSLDHSLTFLSPDDPKLSATYSNIAACFKEQKKLDDALEYLNLALNINLTASHFDQLDIALIYNNIGAVLEEQGKFYEALENYNRALQIYLQHLPDHPNLGNVYNNIATTHLSLKNISEALFYYGKALELCNKSLSVNHPLFALVHYNLAYTLEILNRHSEAVGHAKQSVDIARYSFDCAHPHMKMYEDYYNQLQLQLSVLISLEPTIKTNFVNLD